MNRIVVVEDDDVIREQITRCLTARGYAVAAACDGEEGLVSVYEAPTAVVITDIHMPGLDGFALADALRRDQTLNQPDIIFISSNDEGERFSRALKLGECDFLAKPFTCTRIAGKVEERMARRAANPSMVANRASMEAIAKLPQIAGYRIIRRLGEGAYSQVLLVAPTDASRLDELHALKLLKLPHDADVAEPATSEAIKNTENAENTAERFLDEYAMLASVNHPNVARVYAHGVSRNESGNFLYLDMQYLPGADLRLDIQLGMSPKIVQRRAAELAAALGAIHAAGILHRDLKPANVLMKMTGEAVLADFGVAKKIGAGFEAANASEKNMAVGTPYYMSPEQATASEIDARSDLYSLGIVLFEMLTGLPPFGVAKGDAGISSRDVMQQHLHAPVPKLPTALAAFQTVLDKLLAKKAKDRYADANEARLAILQVSC